MAYCSQKPAWDITQAEISHIKAAMHTTNMLAAHRLSTYIP